MIEQPDGGTRRTFLKRLAGTTLAISAGGAASALAEDKSTTRAAAATVSDAPRRGGTLRVGIVGSGPSETLSPLIFSGNSSLARTQNLYDQLVGLTPDLAGTTNLLAEEFTPSSDFKTWTIRLRDGVTFHDGSDCTADDLLFNVQQWLKPSNDTYGQIGVFIDKAKVRKRDRLTIDLPFLVPFSRPHEFLYGPTCGIIKAGETTFSKPVGTGPFKYQSFTPGQESVMVRNPDYWVTGKPYVDQLHIVSYSDSTSLLNALLGGQIDAMSSLAAAQAKASAASGNINLLVTDQYGPFAFTFQVAKTPFSDVRVREALKFGCNREQIIDVVWLGYATIGNDVPGKGLPDYPSQLAQRPYDPDRAKALLKAAGMSDLTLTLQTSDLGAPWVPMATLYAEQLASSGITCKVETVDAATWFVPPASGRRPFYMEEDIPFLGVASNYFLGYAKAGPYNYSGWNDPAMDKLALQALGAAQPLAEEIWHKIGDELYTAGPQVIWGQEKFIDGLSKSVRGLQPNAASHLDNNQFLNAWLAT